MFRRFLAGGLSTGNLATGRSYAIAVQRQAGGRVSTGWFRKVLRLGAVWAVLPEHGIGDKDLKGNKTKLMG